jgi:polyhydroxyalkanoate synthesis regulator phasin
VRRCGAAPWCVSQAQNHEAVGKRLEEAVAAGELTSQQENAMLGALRRTAQQGEGGGISREDYERAVAEMKKMVADGKASEEDVKARLDEMRRMMAAQSEGGNDDVGGRIARTLVDNGIAKK